MSLQSISLESENQKPLLSLGLIHFEVIRHSLDLQGLTFRQCVLMFVELNIDCAARRNLKKERFVDVTISSEHPEWMKRSVEQPKRE